MGMVDQDMQGYLGVHWIWVEDLGFRGWGRLVALGAQEILR